MGHDSFLNRIKLAISVVLQAAHVSRSNGLRYAWYLAAPAAPSTMYVTGWLLLKRHLFDTNIYKNMPADILAEFESVGFTWDQERLRFTRPASHSGETCKMPAICIDFKHTVAPVEQYLLATKQKPVHYLAVSDDGVPYLTEDRHEAYRIDASAVKDFVKRQEVKLATSGFAMELEAYD